ncbi:NPCBM/NEW2 domain-containing protein [uncultured Fibrobacter sp.]|uniref:NPCBM/NEW2 domain-containing protein n=1 Tax=uncultured Fibrobacter sp. TaxID=261512 RepID=UPI0025E8D229|nr:NPCBM/NEW2 domain-containing protein [uncultured Fibrobacter sp.]
MKIKNYILAILKNLAHPVGIAGVVIALAIPFLVYLAPNIGHKETIRQLDLNLPIPLFCVQFALAIVLIIILNKDFREWFRGILPAKAFSIMALVFAVAVSIFAATQIEARHRVQSDESVFMAVAQNMFYNHESGTCNQGLFSDGKLECTSKSNSFKTKGLSFLYYLGMPLFGSDLHWIFNMELLMLPLAFLLMFFAIVAWTRQPLLAFFASLLLALQPTVLFQFRAMSVEPLYIFLSALSLLVFKWAFDRNTVKHWALLALILAFFAQTRQETAFCLFAFIIFALPKLLDTKDYKAPTFFVTLSLFSVPALLTISYFQGFGFQGGEYEAHGHFIEDLLRNWEIMTKPLNDSGELSNPFLSYFNYLFALGAAYLLFRAFYDLRKKDFFYLEVLAFLVIYHLQTYVILENVSGDFGIEINQRYSLVMLPSMAFVAALPIAHFVETIVKTSLDSKSKNAGRVTVLAAIVVAAVLSGWTAHYKPDFNKNIMYNRNHLTIEEHEILAWLKEMPAKNRLFIYGRPWHFVGYGISSIHYDQARKMNANALKDLMQKYDEVYYIRGLDCWDSQTYHKKAVEHRIATTCDVFEKEMELEGVKNILVTNNYWVQIAKFLGRKSYDPSNIITVGVPEMADTALVLGINLKDSRTEARQWTYKVDMNDRALVEGHYEEGALRVSIPKDTVLTGYNKIVYTVKDQNDKIIGIIEDYYFNAKDGALALNGVKFESHKQAWGTLHTNESIDGNKLTVNGRKFKFGYGTHAASETVFNLEGKFNTFSMQYGLDDESLCSNGVKIQVLGDDKVLAETEFFKAGFLGALTTEIKDIQKLTIKSIANGSIDCAHVDLINPEVK